jgi:uncharacterized tellurite resistance protein B-like protein
MTIDAFFDEISGGMSREEAFMALLLGSVWIDRDEDAREVEEMHGLETRTRTLHGLPRHQIAAIKSRLRPRLVPTRIGELVEDACNSLMTEKHEVRLSIFAHCLDIILADRRWDNLEKKFLSRIVEHMKIDQDEAKKMTIVLLEKNNIRAKSKNRVK